MSNNGKMAYLYDRIEEELEDAHGYLKHAIQYKEQSPELAATLFKLASEEMGHAQILQAAANQEVAARRKEVGVMMPEEMTTVYEWLKCRHAEKLKDLKKMQDVYAGK